MSFNKLTLTPEVSPLKTSLEVLNLSANKISSIDKEYFDGFQRLHTVELNNNQLKSVPCLSSLRSSLQVLKLTNNVIQNLDGLSAPGAFVLLKQIYISSNRIASFNVSLFMNMPNLTVIALNKNKLKTMSDPGPFYPEKMVLLRNPWHCDSRISWMPMKITYRPVVCESPACLRGKLISNISTFQIPNDKRSLLLIVTTHNTPPWNMHTVPWSFVLLYFFLMLETIGPFY